MGKSPSTALVAAVAAAGAVLLPISLFLDWFGATGEGEDIRATGWNALDFTPAALTILAFVVLWVAWGRFGGRGSVFNLLALGVALAIIVLEALITTTPLFELASIGDVSVSREVGVILAAGGAGLVFAAGLIDAAVSYGASQTPGPVHEAGRTAGTSESPRPE